MKKLLLSCFVALSLCAFGACGEESAKDAPEDVVVDAGNTSDASQDASENEEPLDGGGSISDAGEEESDAGAPDCRKDDTLCNDNETCNETTGQCVCKDGVMDCNGICVDITTDPQNCGGCGLKCLPESICEKGVCREPDTYFAYLPYPKRNGAKGIVNFKSYKPNNTIVEDIIKSGVDHVYLKLRWDNWEPESKCNINQPVNESCYTIDPDFDLRVKQYTDAGIPVTVVIYCVPGWAAVSNCMTVQPYNYQFCAPSDEKSVDYARFAGFIAERYNGLNGYGRISDFVISHGANNFVRFNYGCRADYTGECDENRQVQAYRKLFISAYDAILQKQPTARVRIPMSFKSGLSDGNKNVDQGWFIKNFDNPAKSELGGRQWFVSLDIDGQEEESIDATKTEFVNFINILEANYATHNPNAFDIFINFMFYDWISKETESMSSFICNAFNSLLTIPNMQVVDLAFAESEWIYTNETFIHANQPDSLACGFEKLQ